MDRPPRPKKRARVLVADDENDIRDSVKQLLELSLGDVEVDIAIDGKDALEKVRANQYDLILTDYRMPNMDGMEFLKEAQKLAPHTPRIMLTAYPDPALAARAVKEAGVGLFIAKPFDMEYLLDVVGSLLAGDHSDLHVEHRKDTS